MPLSILRWKGGAGGDMLLYMLSSTNTVLNARYVAISKAGKAVADFSWLDFENLTEIQKLSYRPESSQLNLSNLRQEIKQHRQNPQSAWIKSHYYDTNEFNDITVDLVVDPLALPFAIKANIEKTQSSTMMFGKLLSRITDEELKIKYTMYLTARYINRPEQNISDRTINVSELILEREKLQSTLSKHSMIFNDDLYNQWLSYNLVYVPSKQYQTKIANKDYDFMDHELSLVEKYSLMVLANSKFLIL